MNCNKNAIKLVRGNDTNFNGVDFLTLDFASTELDLSTFSGVFKLGNIVKTFESIAEPVIINFTAEETKLLPQFCNGILQLVDNEHRIATIESLIPFEVVSVVHGDAIVTEPYHLSFDVKQSGEVILNFNVKVAGGVQQIYMGDTEPTDENILVWIDTYTPPPPEDALITADNEYFITADEEYFVVAVPKQFTTSNNEELITSDNKEFLVI